MPTAPCPGSRTPPQAVGALVPPLNLSASQVCLSSRRVPSGATRNATLQKKWLYRSGLQIVAEIDDNGVMSRFGYSGGRNVPGFMIRNSVPYRIITDHLGSVRLVEYADRLMQSVHGL